MKKSNSVNFNLFNSMLVIATLLCLFLTPASACFRQNGVNKEVKGLEKETGDSPKTFIKSASIEAVMPFLHADLLDNLYHYAIAYYPACIKILYIPIVPAYIDKYRKTLFLFIIASNAP